MYESNVRNYSKKGIQRGKESECIYNSFFEF